MIILLGTSKVKENNTINICIIENKKDMTRKVKCYAYNNVELNRELAVHADYEDHSKSCISDVITGLRLTTIPKKFESIDISDINTSIEAFIKHYSIELINKEFQKHNTETGSNDN